jgi:hypothetical protein
VPQLPNKVVAENCRAGNAREEWEVNGTGDLEIQGFDSGPAEAGHVRDSDLS